jgi:hypothetical protein
VAQVSSTTPDPDAVNNRAVATIDVSGLPEIVIYASSVAINAGQLAVDPNATTTVNAALFNHGERATAVALHVTLPEGGTFVSAEPYGDGDCSVSATEIVCQWLAIEHQQDLNVAITYVTVDRDDGEPSKLHFTADAAEPDFDPSQRARDLAVPLRKRFNVENGFDEGFGSLRQAMLDAAASCAARPCLIRIRTSDTIQPHTPLPAVSGYVKFDGGATKATLDGSLLAEGNALGGAVCELQLMNLVIRDFPGHAIEAHGGTGCSQYSPNPLLVSNNVIAGNVRGVVAKQIVTTINDNIIRDQKRAGIFIDEATQVAIRDNVITGNGASGIFVNLRADGPYYGIPAFASIERNIIRDNGEWGIARTNHGLVGVVQNSIAGNRLYAIDVDLDLDHPALPSGSPLPPTPHVVSATFDAVRQVTVVRVQSVVGLSVDLFASDAPGAGGYPQAEQWLMSRYAQQDELEVELEGDLRGKWITATATQVHTPDWFFILPDTSEVSNAVPVN